MNDYITKPFTVGQIAACLRRHLAKGGAEIVALPAPAGDEDVVIDDAVIGDLRQIGGSEALFRRVLDLFVSRVPLAVDRIQSVATTNDLKARADAAHALKSMCANVGARRAAAACDRLETAARRNEAFDAGTLTATIIAEVRAVMSRLEDLRAA
ncbi:MAG: Hpt domain-containing protein [Alphaproteobacteria bacterium]|nr:Hpt domain-containing protein [Alphaproteobacteria bacterium]